MIDHIRRYQKILVLGVAIGVTVLYMTPLDQILAVSEPGGGLNNTRASADRVFGHAIAVVEDNLDGSDRANNSALRQPSLNARDDAAIDRLQSLFGPL